MCKAKGSSTAKIPVWGGGTKNPMFLRERADIAGCELVLPKEPEAVLLGSAVLGSVAAGAHKDVVSAMTVAGRTITPTKGKVAAYHAAKHRVFLQMHKDRVHLRKLMAG